MFKDMQFFEDKLIQIEVGQRVIATKFNISCRDILI